MSEEQGKYQTETDEVREAMDMLGKGYNTSDPAAIIHPPKTVNALSETGLIEYRVWGWVKVSANFIHHIRKLKGAKLAIWQVIALAIDENGKCSLTIKQICALSGYSHTEVIDSIKELEEWGYLSVKKDGKGRMYTPEFAARGDKSPGKQVKKLESSENNDSSPQKGNDSSLAIEISTTSIKELKESLTKKPDLIDLELQKKAMQDKENEALKVFERDMQTPGNWTWYPAKTSIEKEWRDLREFVKKLYATDPTCFARYNTWRNQPYSKGSMSNRQIKNYPSDFQASWSDFEIRTKMYPSETGDPNYVRPEFQPVQEKKGNFVPPPASLRKPRPVSG